MHRTEWADSAGDAKMGTVRPCFLPIACLTIRVTNTGSFLLQVGNTEVLKNSQKCHKQQVSSITFLSIHAVCKCFHHFLREVEKKHRQIKITKEYWVMSGFFYTAAMGLVYCFFLVFQSDIRNFMFAFQTFKFKSICCNKSYKFRFLRKKIQEEEEMCMTSHKTSSNGLCRHHDNHNVDCTTEMLPEDKDDCDTKQDNESNEDKEPRKAGASFLIILFYYFQDALLLHIDTGGVLHCQ